MAGATIWACVLLTLLQSGFTEELECVESNLGTIALHSPAGNYNSKERGTVVVCIKNATSTNYTSAAFCYGNEWTFNDAAGHAACRQAGYVKANNVDSNVKLGTGSPDMGGVFTNIQCPVDKSYINEGEINLLRCSHGKPTYNKTPNCNLAAVECDITPLYEGDPYNGQVYVDAINGFEYLHINYSGKTLPVCAEGYTNATLDSICQQMGYTEAWLSPETIQPINPGDEPDSNFWNLGNVSCDHGPYPCFTDCFDQEDISIVSHCQTRLLLKCIYNESNAAVAGSGNKGTCEITESCSALNPLAIGMISASCILFVPYLLCIIYCAAKSDCTQQLWNKVKKPWNMTQQCWNDRKKDKDYVSLEEKTDNQT